MHNLSRKLTIQIPGPRFAGLRNAAFDCLLAKACLGQDFLWALLSLLNCLPPSLGISSFVIRQCEAFAQTNVQASFDVHPP